MQAEADPRPGAGQASQSTRSTRAWLGGPTSAAGSKGLAAVLRPAAVGPGPPRSPCLSLLLWTEGRVTADEAGPRAGTQRGSQRMRLDPGGVCLHQDPQPSTGPGGSCPRRPSHGSSPGVDVAGASGLPGALTYLRPQTRYAGQEADEDVGVHAPLVRFVNDHHLVLRQQEVLRGGPGMRPASRA